MGAPAFVAVLTVQSAVGASGHLTSRAAVSGSTLTVLEGSSFAGDWSDGLAPATNANGLANQSIMNAIYGDLFSLGPHGRTEPDLATGYTLSNGNRTFTIHLRHGVTFSDGTPFNAAAVAYNFQLDLKAKLEDSPTWTPTSITTPTPYTVVVHLPTADGAIVDEFQDSNVNWIASPTALKKMGIAAFSRLPVGAGPFVVVSDSFSSKLVLKRNPRYWQAGHPYLAGLVFETTANDETALEDLRSGVAQAYEEMGTPQLVQSYKAAGLVVTPQLGTAPDGVQFNSLAPPFNNVVAREAVYYATNARLLDQKLISGQSPLAETFMTPADVFYDATVPGYRTYDLAKAKALVRTLGGLSFNLLTFQNGQSQSYLEALQAMYQAAGMKVTISNLDLSGYIEQQVSGKWQAELGAIGGWDPADGTGVAFRYSSHSPFSGVHSPTLDKLIVAAQATAVPAQRAKLYDQIARYISLHALTAWLFPGLTWNVTVKGVSGPGLTTTNLPSVTGGPEIPWQDVRMSGTAK